MQVAAKSVLFVIKLPFHMLANLFSGSAGVVPPSLRPAWGVEKG